MNDLQQRLIAAERSGATGVDALAAKYEVMRSVQRRRTGRALGMGVGAIVAAAGVTLAALNLVNIPTPVPPAIQPQVVDVTSRDAVSVTKLDQGEYPTFPSSARVFDLIDDRWALAMWEMEPNAGVMLIIVGPDGSTWNANLVAVDPDAQLLAWNPAARTALISTSPRGAKEISADAELAVISLDRTENAWTSECMNDPGAPVVEQYAAAFEDGYVVRNGCGEEFFTTDGSVRTELTDQQQVALLDAVFPRAGITGIEPNDHGVMVGNTDLFMDTTKCVPLVMPRQYLVGVGCQTESGFEVDAGQIAGTVVPLTGVDTLPNISKLCGTGALYGTLSDGSVGVGTIEGDHAVALTANGSPIDSCRDGRYTWYIAGGDLYFSVSLDEVTRVIDLTTASGSDTTPRGVLDVAPAPALEPLG
ncbi:hypothetical protein [Demequina sp.]|uniref:hypothetical protein n=1 Tax=Demequina sp. TaxID=2050685 RepID=UPI003D0FBDC8